MPFSRTLTVVGCHAEGEVGDVITGGVLDVPGSNVRQATPLLERKRQHTPAFTQ
jgi:proline racemase